MGVIKVRVNAIPSPFKPDEILTLFDESFIIVQVDQVAKLVGFL